ncbi:DUF6115 domain-containing protein [Paenibacillus gallinarum]|uniref:DUF2802 domain-containing protein n=1 Tax=Paenibacillus gallinarum TaxID=2762232 RepID=A0ABR8SUR4_9BACL|nr:hypothetical protein [Paenibacillus gallinarum]MBD7967247.1 hypothetical protein [Paenibacillus gallinarum]
MEPWSTLVVLGVGITLFAWFMPRSRPQTGGKVIKDVETTLEQYLAEIELENEKVIQSIQKWKQDFSHTNNLKEKEIQDMKQQIINLEQQVSALMNANAFSNMNVEAAVKKTDYAVADDTVIEEIVIQEEPTIHKRYSEVFHLESEGKSTDYIAKKLDMPKGEVQLILQLGERERMI